VSRLLQRSDGFTLVELLVGIALGVLTVSAVLPLFVSNKQHFLVQLEAGRLQENQRFVVQFLTRDIRGPEGDASGVRAENSDKQVFAVVRSRETKACTGGTNRINGICPGDYLLISDCRKAWIFQVGSIDDSGAITHPTGGLDPGNSDGTWGGATAPSHERFGTDSEIIRYDTFIYYLAHNPGGEPALYRKASRGRTEELVEGVEDMQILYGENTDADADGTPDRFVAAVDVTDWDDVTTVRVWALLRGFQDNMAEAEQSYPALDGTMVTAPDKRLRRTLLLTISLRNRLP